MKKSLAVLSILACMLGLVACGSQSVSVETPLMTSEDAADSGKQVVDTFNLIIRSDAIDQYEADEVIYNSLIGYQEALDEIGGFVEVTDVKSEIGSEDAVINVLIHGNVRDANMEIAIDNKEGLKSITTTVQYAFGEMMAKAGLNTLIGMGTVFAVLILICLIISLFKLIPAIQDAFSGKSKTGEKSMAVEAVDNTIAQIIQKEDDLELVAVIAAAIAASEGAANTDGYVVRSIRRR